MDEYAYIYLDDRIGRDNFDPLVDIEAPEAWYRVSVVLEGHAPEEIGRLRAYDDALVMAWHIIKQYLDPEHEETRHVPFHSVCIERFAE